MIENGHIGMETGIFPDRHVIADYTAGANLNPCAEPNPVADADLRGNVNFRRNRAIMPDYCAGMDSGREFQAGQPGKRGRKI